VRVVQGVADRGGDLSDIPRRHPVGVALPQQPSGIRSVDEVHGDPQLAVEFTAVVDADDVRVVQRGDQFSLPVEPGPKLRICRHRGGQDLQGVVAGQSWMRDQIHLAHAAEAERPEDLISGE
jgi:hypothetical protein